jgi:hypothetical protein
MTREWDFRLEAIMKFLSVHTATLMLSLNAVKSRFSADCVRAYVCTYVLQGIDTRNLIYAFMMQRYTLDSFLLQ